MQKALIAAALAVSLAGCATSDVTKSCADAAQIVALAQPWLALAPPEVHAALAIIQSGASACGSEPYARARETVLQWVKSKTAK